MQQVRHRPSARLHPSELQRYQLRPLEDETMLTGSKRMLALLAWCFAAIGTSRLRGHQPHAGRKESWCCATMRNAPECHDEGTRPRCCTSGRRGTARWLMARRPPAQLPRRQPEAHQRADEQPAEAGHRVHQEGQHGRRIAEWRLHPGCHKADAKARTGWAAPTRAET